MKKLVLLAVIALGLNAQSLVTKLDGSLKVYNCELKDGKYFVSKNKFFRSNERIIVEFEDKAKREALEEKYGLKGEVFYGNKFIYNQNGKNIEKLFKDLSDEKEIKTVQPNWTKVYKKF